jgi:hypothetical protein
MNTEVSLEDVVRAYLAATDGDAVLALRLALADAREALGDACASISYGYIRGQFPVGPAVPVGEPEARANVAPAMTSD